MNGNRCRCFFPSAVVACEYPPVASQKTDSGPAKLRRATKITTLATPSVAHVNVWLCDHTDHTPTVAKGKCETQKAPTKTKPRNHTGITPGGISEALIDCNYGLASAIIRIP